MKKIEISIIAILMLCISIIIFKYERMPLKIYVSPFGTEDGDGSISDPVKTIENAFRLIECLEAENIPINVYLREGTYSIIKPITIENNTHKITICSYGNEKAIISASFPISGFNCELHNGVNMFVKQFDQDLEISSLFSDSRRLENSRYPEDGYLLSGGYDPEDCLWTQDNTPWSFSFGQKSFFGKFEDFSFEFTNPKDMIVRVFHYWHDELAYVNDIKMSTSDEIN